MYLRVSADNFEICQFRTFFASRANESLGLEKPEIRPEKQITSNKTGRSVRNRSGAVRNAVRNAVRTDWTGPEPSEIPERQKLTARALAILRKLPKVVVALKSASNALLSRRKQNFINIKILLAFQIRWV